MSEPPIRKAGHAQSHVVLAHQSDPNKKRNTEKAREIERQEDAIGRILD